MGASWPPGRACMVPLVIKSVGFCAWLCFVCLCLCLCARVLSVGRWGSGPRPGSSKHFFTVYECFFHSCTSHLARSPRDTNAHPGSTDPRLFFIAGNQDIPAGPAHVRQTNAFINGATRTCCIISCGPRPWCCMLASDEQQFAESLQILRLQIPLSHKGRVHACM